MDPLAPGNAEKREKKRWWRPAEAVANSLAGVVLVAFRGCWHRQLSWPVAEGGYTYRVCLNCGAKRLFDEKTFTAHGPFRYDMNELITAGKSAKPESQALQNVSQPTPSR